MTYQKFTLVLSATILLSFTSTLAAQAQQSWTFTSDDYSWFGHAAAPASAVDEPAITFRCMAKGADIEAYPGDKSSVSLFEPTNNAFTFLVSKHLNPVQAASGSLINVSVSVDGQSYGASSFVYLPPEGAFAARVPTSHSMLPAIKGGRILTLRNTAEGTSLSVPLVGSSKSLNKLERFCNSPRRGTPALPVLPTAEGSGHQAPADGNLSQGGTSPVSSSASGNSNSNESRVAAFGATWFPNTVLEDKDGKRKEFARLVSLALLNWKRDDLKNILSNADTAIRQLAHFPEEQSRKIYLNATGSDEQFLARRLQTTRLNPFELQRLAEEVRASLPSLLDTAAPSFPMNVRIFCYINLGQYDFETRSFPFSRSGSSNYDLEACRNLGLVPGVLTVPLSGDPVGNLENFPERLRMEPAQAEALIEALGGNPSAPMYVDAELTAEWKTGGRRGNEFQLNLAAAGPYFLTLPSDLETPILQMIAQKKPTSEELTARKLSGEDPWDARNPDDQAKLMELALRVGPGHSAPVSVFAEPGKFGRFRVRWSMGQCENDPQSLCPFVPNPVNFRVHEDLKIPSDYIIGWHTGGVGSDALSGVGVVLPSVEKNYRMPVPGNGNFRRTDVIFEFGLADVFLVEAERFRQPVLMLAGVPKSAGLFLQGGQEPSEWITLPQPAVSLNSILETVPAPSSSATDAPVLHNVELELLGVRPGMPKEAAESMVNAKMSVGWAGGYPNLTVAEPFQKGVTAFVSADGRDQIQLIESLGGTGAIQAVARSQFFDSSNSLDGIKELFVENLGEPQVQEKGNQRYRLVWSTGTVSRWSNDNPCVFKVQPSSGVRPQMDAINGQGRVHTMPAHKFTPAIQIGGPLSLKGLEMVSERLETPGIFKNCGQTLVTEILQLSDGILALHGLVDLEGFQH